MTGTAIAATTGDPQSVVPRAHPIGPVDRLRPLALADLPGSGQLTPVIDRTYLLEDVADALRSVGAGHTRGNVVVTV